MSREQEIYQYSRMEIDSNMTKEQFRKRLAQGKMMLDGGDRFQFAGERFFRREYALRSGY